MKYIIERASHILCKPCEKSYEDKFIAFCGEIQSRWAIDINSIEELMELQNQVGDIIVRNSSEGPTLIIYDDYIE